MYQESFELLYMNIDTKKVSIAGVEDGSESMWRTVQEYDMDVSIDNMSCSGRWSSNYITIWPKFFWFQTIKHGTIFIF